MRRVIGVATRTLAGTILATALAVVPGHPLIGTAVTGAWYTGDRSIVQGYGCSSNTIEPTDDTRFTCTPASDGKQHVHEGIDLAFPSDCTTTNGNYPVYAAYPGKVVTRSDPSGYGAGNPSGVYAILEMDGGNFAVLGHQKYIVPSVIGTHVVGGTFVGYVGYAGGVCHLHFEVDTREGYHTSSVNPSPWLTGQPPITDGSFVQTPDLKIYRIAGGAPLPITDCATLGGCTQVRQVASLAQFAQFPTNGTWLLAAVTGPNSGTVYHVAGAAPLQIVNCAPFGGNGCAPLESQWVAVNPSTISTLGRDASGVYHLSSTPFNGTWLLASDSSPSSGTVYHVAGGTPLMITNCAPFGGNGCAPLASQWVVVNTETISTLGRDAGGAPHFTAVPINGTWLLATDSSPNSGLVYRVAGGDALNINDCVPFGGGGCSPLASQWVVVNVDTITSLGLDGSGAHHLYSEPTDGTVLEGLPTQSYWQITTGYRSNLAPPQPTAVAVDDYDVGLFPCATGISCPVP